MGGVCYSQTSYTECGITGRTFHMTMTVELEYGDCSVVVVVLTEACEYQDDQPGFP